MRDAVVVAVGSDRPPARRRDRVPTRSEVDPEAVRAFVADRLPAYMVPEHVAVLDRLPLSGNGKVDRPALTRRLAEGTDRSTTVEPPVGPVETTLATLWADLLGVPTVGRGDSFFTLGGDSLLATRLLGRMRSAGLAGGQLRRLFATPTLAGFAAGLRLDTGAGLTGTFVADPAHRHDPFPRTDVQRAYWMGRTGDFALGDVGLALVLGVRRRGRGPRPAHRGLEPAGPAARDAARRLRPRRPPAHPTRGARGRASPSPRARRRSPSCANGCPTASPTRPAGRWWPSRPSATASIGSGWRSASTTSCSTR